MSLDDESMPDVLNLPISLIPFGIQLQNVLPIEMVAKRFPVDFVPETALNSDVNLINVSIDSDSQLAQVIIETKVEPIVEPKPFEIGLKIVGIFTFPQKYSFSDVQEYLQSGSIGALFPFIRECIWHLSVRLQIPPIMLPVIQLAAPKSTEESE